MPYLKRINSLPLINHISYKYAKVSDIGPSWSSCFKELVYFIGLLDKYHTRAFCTLINAAKIHHCFSSIIAIASIHAMLEFLLPVVHKMFFSSYWLLSHTTIIGTMFNPFPNKPFYVSAVQVF